MDRDRPERRRAAGAGLMSLPPERSCCPRFALSTALACLALCTAHPSAGAAEFASPDSVRLRWEVGASSDLSNEIYYEDAFVDTTFLGRRSITSPEARYAGVAMAALHGTRAQGRVGYVLQNDLSLGDRIQSGSLGLRWRQSLGPDWLLNAAPHLEYRRDRTFGRDLEQWRGRATMRLRRTLADGATFADLGTRGEFLRTRGPSAAFIPDREVGGASAALEHAALLGGEWRAGYNFVARAFPDSSERDHFEHGWQGSWRTEAENGSSLWLETEGERRRTWRYAPTTRDNFYEERLAVEGQARSTASLAWTLRVEGEALQYDRQDSLLYFNYEIVRAHAGPRFESLGPWTLTVAPRGEILTSRVNPSETYREIGGGVECQRLSPGSWWSIAPAAGWRDYGRPAPDVPSNTPEVHSSFAFYELTLLADVAAGRDLRIRMTGTGRAEFHTDSAQNAQSLYLSLDVRKLF